MNVVMFKILAKIRNKVSQLVITRLPLLLVIF